METARKSLRGGGTPSRNHHPTTTPLHILGSAQERARGSEGCTQLAIKCRSVLIWLPAGCSGALSAFAYRQPIANWFACSGGEPAQKFGVPSSRLGLFGVFFCLFFFFSLIPEGQLEFRCPFPLFFWFAVTGSHAVSSVMSSPAFPSPRGTRRGEVCSGRALPSCRRRRQQICKPGVINCHVC